MRIGIDYTSAARQRAGIGRYTRALVHALGRTDQKNEYALLQPRDARFRSELPSNFRQVTAPLSERALVTLWQRLSLPLPVELFLGSIDIFYSPDFVLPPTRAKKKIVTIHDLSFKRVPETAVPNLRWYLEGAVPKAVRRADVILADSNATRADVIEVFGVPPDRVETLYSAAEDFICRVTDPLELSEARERYGLEKPFILSVGTVEPRKNLVGLIEAFARLQQRDEVDLIIAGGNGWLYEEILQAPARFGVANSVRFLGFVPDGDLPALYSLATLFAYPSFYEGFGLPVLEGMACGTPIVASSTSSIPEVAGEAALLVDPHDTDALRDAIDRVLRDEKLRTELKAKGLERARRFSWEASSRQLLAAFERV